MILASDLYPDMFINMADGVNIPNNKVKDWLDYVEKSEYGVTITSGNTLVMKTKAGDFIVADSYKVLPKEILDERREEGENIETAIKEFLNDEN